MNCRMTLQETGKVADRTGKATQQKMWNTTSTTAAFWLSGAHTIPWRTCLMVCCRNACHWHVLCCQIGSCRFSLHCISTAYAITQVPAKIALATFFLASTDLYMTCSKHTPNPAGIELWFSNVHYIALSNPNSCLCSCLSAHLDHVHL